MDKNSIRREILALVNSIASTSNILEDENEISRADIEHLFSDIEKLYQKSIVFNHIRLHGEFMAKVHLSPELPIQTTQIQEVVPSIQETIASTSETKIELPVIEAKVNQPEISTEKKQKKNPVEDIQRPSITDLKTEIGINDKFLFANELFKGSMQEYSVAIQQLNICDTYESAMLYFQSLQQLYNWDPKNETQKRLLELVDRRYN